MGGLGRAGEGLGFIPYNKKLTALARENRKNPTAPESRMWNEVLRMRHFAEYKFLRQKPIADFIVDFYCAELRLAVEIDGDSHAAAVEYDAARSGALNALGIQVIRYTNDDVMKNLEGVYDDLLRGVEQIRDGVTGR
jgi:very-short-patch-repair endonuclease